MHELNRARRRRPLNMVLTALVAVSLIVLVAPVQSAQTPSTNPTTAPSTAPAAAGPTKPAKNRAFVSGTVLDADGKPAVGLTIRVEKNEPFAMGGGPQKDTGPKEYTTTTDENGNFLIKDLHINAYMLIAGNQEIGWIYQELVVKAGEETKVGTLKLTKV